MLGVGVIDGVATGVCVGVIDGVATGVCVGVIDGVGVGVTDTTIPASAEFVQTSLDTTLIVVAVSGILTLKNPETKAALEISVSNGVA